MTLTRLRHGFVRWLLHDVHLPSLHVGEHSISLSPAGVGDVARWSATKNSVAAGDLGMDTATGRPQAFIGSGNKALAHTGELGAVVVNSGSVTRAAATATGTQAVPHGLGVAPKALWFIGSNDANTQIFSMGWANGIGTQAEINNHTVGSANDLTRAIVITDSSGNGHNAKVTAVDGTNFTLSWVRLGTGLAITVKWLALA